jgi:hypothetical protein
MERRLSASLTFAAGMLSAVLIGQAQGPTPATVPSASQDQPVLDRFLPTADAPPVKYRALRRLTARAGDRVATLTAWTSFDPTTGFSYEITEESGSGLIRSKVLHAALEAEKSAKQADQRARAALTPANYEFTTGEDASNGLQRIRIKPRRKEAMMIDGSILLTTTDADLVRVEGVLVKRPSFWTRRVEVTRDYSRIAGMRLPVMMSSVADVLFVGRSTFEMRYEYESVNGQPVSSVAQRVR